MNDILFEAVFQNGEIKTSKTLSDLVNLEGYLFLVKKEEGYRCRTYSHYRATVVDESGQPKSANYKGFSFDSFRIDGNASDYQLQLTYLNPDGSKGYREFKSDISYNHPSEGYSRIRTEWQYSTQYRDIFDYFDNVQKYGQEGYAKILELERTAYSNDAAFRQERDEYNHYKDQVRHLIDCIQELTIPECQTTLSELTFDGLHLKNLHRLVIPKSVTWIERIPFPFCDSIRQVFCMAEEPPQIGTHYRKYSMNTELYVLKESLEKYLSDPGWSDAFINIKGL